MQPDQLKDLNRVERVSTFFELDPFEYQQDLLEYGEENDVAKAAVKPGRQVGKTVLGGAIAAERALSGHDVMILGPFQDTVSEMMEAARNHLNTSDQKFSNTEELDGIGTTKRNKTDWEFSNGGRLRSRTVGTDGTQIRGKNPDIVLVDEAAYIQESIFTEVIEPFFSTHKTWEFYLFSTPAGKSGYFYNKVVDDETFYSPHWPSKICPLISEEWLEKKRQELDTQTFQQEYLGEFLDDGDTLFSVEEINQLKGETSLSNKRYLGVDVARKGTDQTVYTEIDEHGNVRIAGAEQQSTMDGVLGRIRDLNNQYNYETVVVEENSMGGGVVDFADVDEIVPFNSSTKSKHKLYKNLQRVVENGDITLPDNRSLIDQLTSLRQEYTQHGYMKVSHPDGGHDDYPDSLAFALWARDKAGRTTRRKSRYNKVSSK